MLKDILYQFKILRDMVNDSKFTTHQQKEKRKSTIECIGIIEDTIKIAMK